MDTVRVLIADGQPLFSEALASALERYPGVMTLEDRPSSSEDALSAITAYEPHVALVDYWIPGEWPVIDLLQRLKEMRLKTKTVLLSWLYSESDIEVAIEAGAAGFLPKSVGIRYVIEAVHLAHAGDFPVFEEKLKGLTERIHSDDEQAIKAWDRLKDLTPRERKILVLLASGLEVKQIGDQLSISRETTRTHIGNLLKKTGSTSRMELVALARNYGLVQP